MRCVNYGRTCVECAVRHGRCRCLKEEVALLIIFGIVLLVLGSVINIPVLVSIGGLLVVIGVVLWILGATGRAIGGRKHYY